MPRRRDRRTAAPTDTVSARRRAARRRRLGLAAAATVAVLALQPFADRIGFLRNIEAESLNLRFQLRGPTAPGPETAIVMIDDRTIARLGRWPVSRRHLATAVDRLTAAGARVIAFDLLLLEPERPRGDAERPADGADGSVAAASASADQPGDAPGDPGDPAGAGRDDPAPDAAAEPAPGDRSIGADQRLAEAIAASGRVVVPFAFTFDAAADPDAVDPLTPEAQRAAIRIFHEPPGGGEVALPRPTGALTPLAGLAAGAAGLGHVSVLFDSDSTLRYDFPVFAYDWDYFPSLSLETARHYLGLAPDQMVLHLGRGIALGDRFVPTDGGMRHLVNYHGAAGSFPTYSLIDLIEGGLDPALFRDRAVLIGASVLGIDDSFATPFTSGLPGVERNASIFARIVTGDHLARPDWVDGLELLLVVGLGAAAAAIAGGLATAWVIPGGFALLAAWAAANTALFTVGGLWVGFVVPTLALGLNTGIAYWARVRAEEDERRHAEQALRISEERYALAARGANDGLWDWDLETGKVYYSPRWYTMMGLEPPATDGAPAVRARPADWLERIRGDDRTTVEAAIAAHTAGTSNQLAIEYRVTHPDGGERWMLARGLAVRDDTGRARRIAGSQTDITFRKRAEKDAIVQAFEDGLTGLANRALLTDRLTQVLGALVRAGGRSDGMLIRLNLDGFRMVNDGLGQPAGDRVLIAIARRLERVAGPGDTVARLSADEFAVLMPGLDDDAAAVAAMTDHLMVLIAKPVPIDGRDVVLAASLGVVALAPLVAAAPPVPEAATVLRNADLAVHAAKEAGGARAARFEASLEARAVRRFDLATELRCAIEEGDQLRLVYQPIIDLARRRLAGFEALMRWEHPARGMVSPGDFVPLAEETGLIEEMGRWAIAAACTQIAAWQRLHGTVVPVAVNISGRQFAADIDRLERDVVQATTAAGIGPGLLKLEVTESTVMDHPERVAEALRRIIGLGVKVSIDDFGTGYSSLAYLHRFPFHTLKIDRSFVIRMTETNEAFEVVRTIVALARALGRDLVAEGIETEDQAARLATLGVENGQGFLFSRPLPPSGAGGFLGQARVG